MLEINTEKVISKTIMYALICVTLGLATGGVTDPVNAPKFLILGCFSFALLGIIIRTKITDQPNSWKFSVLTLGIFIASSFWTLVTSVAPITQSLYGVYGRNNGFLLYLFLPIVFFAASLLRRRRSFDMALRALMISGIINIVYGLWVVIFGDFIGWSNPYGNLLGTLGNPNFAGSFYGIFAVYLFANLFKTSNSTKNRAIFLVLLIFTFYCIIETRAVQGKVLFVVGLTIVTFYWIKTKRGSSFFLVMFVGLVISLGTFSLLGALQKGPFTQFIYKESVSLRGQYWSAGLKIGIENPFHGVGFDSYGDWYRYSRQASALVRPGVDTVSNTAHNVVIDFFASGGLPLVASYLLINFFVLYKVVHYSFKVKQFDPLHVTLIGAWACYQLQSLISINQIGLAIWGWVLGGLLIGLLTTREMSEPTGKNPNNRKQKISEREIFGPYFRASIMAIIGLFIALPPLSSDINWRKAQDSRNATELEKITEISYLNPTNSYALNSITGVFESSGLTDTAHKIALKAVKFNPNSYDSWRNLYVLKASTADEKKTAIKNMRRLDPLNPLIRSNN